MTAGGAALRIFIDGASRGNPGDAGFGVHVEAEDGSAIAGLYGYPGRATNNVAEYEALLHALRWALERGAREIRVFSDSELVVKQMGGVYKVKHPDMAPRHREAQALLRRFGKALPLAAALFYGTEKASPLGIVVDPIRGRQLRGGVAGHSGRILFSTPLTIEVTVE